MTKQDKLLSALKDSKSTFEWDKLLTVMNFLGYRLVERTGSRVVFIHQDDDNDRLHLHKPHPENYLKGGALKSVKMYLKNKGRI
ncbi:MAG: type II toxin-antitoxin system HicA family toxin [Neisseriaceae bacterium]|nr:type II toxin-antitoxin system HicA family toxin [Neisseriaceae bacterium]